MEKSVETLIVGGGQAGLAMSEHLSQSGGDHLILERQRIVERWRTARWDSLVANGPAWHDRFPSREFQGIGPDEFPTRDMVIEYFEAYAKQIDAPIRCGVNVTSVRKLHQQAGFRVSTSEGEIKALNVVAATGPFQQPVIPPIVPDQTAGIVQIHSNAYENPDQLPDGAVIVVGAGSSGSQIAAELLQAGKEVYLSVGPHDRPPRRYRGRDFVWWLGVLGKWDAESLAPGSEHVTIAVSGAHGGHTVDFRQLAASGMHLVGVTESYDNGVLQFVPDLADNIAQGDANYLSVLDEADEYVKNTGISLPDDPDARQFCEMPSYVTDPIRSLDLKSANITSIVWATGYAVNYDWLEVDVLDEQGKPKHHRGISAVPGVYFLGLPWQTRRGSSFIWGVWHDARYLADHIAKQRAYLDYHDKALV